MCEIREGSLLCFIIKSVSYPELLIIWTVLQTLSLACHIHSEMCTNPSLVVSIYSFQFSTCTLFVFKVEFDIDVESDLKFFMIVKILAGVIWRYIDPPDIASYCCSLISPKERAPRFLRFIFVFTSKNPRFWSSDKMFECT